MRAREAISPLHRHRAASPPGPRALPLLLALAVNAPVQAAPCPEPTTTVDLDTALEQAEWSYAQVELEAFLDHARQAATLVPCLEEQVPPNVAARVHRVQGLLGFVERDPTRSTRAFAAARAIEPAYRFPATLVPAGNPVWADYEAIPLDTGTFGPAAPPAEGFLLLDGRESGERPQDWPVLFQHVSATGAIEASAYLWPDEPLPPYPVDRPEDPPEPALEPTAEAEHPTSGPLTPEPPSPDPEPIPPDPTTPDPTTPAAAPRPVTLALLGTAGASALTAGVFYVMARQSSATYWDEATPYEDLETLREQTNRRALVSGGLGALALTTAGAGIWIHTRW